MSNEVTETTNVRHGQDHQDTSNRKQKHELKHVCKTNRPVATEHRVTQHDQTTDDDEIFDWNAQRDRHKARQRKEAHRAKHQLTWASQPRECLVRSFSKTATDVLNNCRYSRPSPRLSKDDITKKESWNCERHEEDTDHSLSIREPGAASECPYRETGHERCHARYPPLNAVPTFQK